MKVVELSGGVGGARMARGLAAVHDIDLTVIVNVGDDLPTHGLHIAPDLDTMVYTLAGVQGPHGWGRSGDSFVTNSELARFGLNNDFKLGDLDLALKIFRTLRLTEGSPLSEVTDTVRASFDIRSSIIPASDDPVRTVVTTDEGDVLSFQEYFVNRGHRDHVASIEFEGAKTARPAPGVIAAIESADTVIIGPSNPVMSIWPILSVEPIRDAVRAHHRVVAISPLIGGRALRGPADVVLSDLGIGVGTGGVLAAYQGLIEMLVVDSVDKADTGTREGVKVVAHETLISEPAKAEQLARAILGL